MTSIALPALRWRDVLRLGLVQAALGAVVVLVISTLNRVMVVEYGFPAVLPGVLVALHYVVQMSRPRFGYGSDRGGRRTPWIIGGMAVLSAGGVLCAWATVLLPVHRYGGLALAVVAYSLVGAGAGAAGTSLLVLLAKRVDERRRAAAATLMWVLMIAGFALTSGLVGHFLDPFSAGRLLMVVSVASATALAIAVGAVWNVEGGAGAADRAIGAAPAETSAAPRPATFAAALRAVWAEPAARRFTLFVFISMLAYSAQELLIEPFSGLVFGLSVGASTRLSGTWHGAVLIGMILVGVGASGLFRSGSRPFGSLSAWTSGGCVASAGSLVGLAMAGYQNSAVMLEICVVLLGLANGVFAVSAIGSMMELATRGAAGGTGVRMGIWGAAQAIAFALGGVLGTLLVDSIRFFFGSPVGAFALVFVVEAILFCVAGAFVVRAGAPGSSNSLTNSTAVPV